MGTMGKWRPAWWSEQVHGSAWERVREAMRRDWMQTKHDLHIGGHEMNQSAADTVKQAIAKEHLPDINKANPPKVIGEWDEAEIPYGYGYAARRHFGANYPHWNDALENELEKEWTRGPAGRDDWNSVRVLVQRGYEYDERSGTWGQLPVVRSPAEKADASPGHRE